MCSIAVYSHKCHPHALVVETILSLPPGPSCREKRKRPPSVVMHVPQLATVLGRKNHGSTAFHPSNMTLLMTRPRNAGTVASVGRLTVPHAAHTSVLRGLLNMYLCCTPSLSVYKQS